MGEIMIESRNIDDLNPIVAEMCRKFIATCKTEGVDCIITSTYRDNASQNELYAQGRTLPGKIVTNAKGGESFHNYRIAFDFCPIVNGKCQWDNTALFEKCGDIAESIGLEWAGRWMGKIREMAHCQYGGLTLAELKSGVTIS